MSEMGKKPEQQEGKLTLVDAPDYRETYANSVQVKMSVWDFVLVFGTLHPQTNEEMTIRNHQGVYLSPQQAKALWNVLGQNLAQYEQTFGELNLDPQFKAPGGPVH
jgi:hypothetical protein